MTEYIFLLLPFNPLIYCFHISLSLLSLSCCVFDIISSPFHGVFFFSFLGFTLLFLSPRSPSLKTILSYIIQIKCFRLKWIVAINEYFTCYCCCICQNTPQTSRVTRIDSQKIQNYIKADLVQSIEHLSKWQT